MLSVVRYTLFSKRMNINMPKQNELLARREFLSKSARFVAGAAAAASVPQRLQASQQPTVSTPFDPRFTLDVMMPCALAAYRVMDFPDDPRLPSGFEKVGLLKADLKAVNMEMGKLNRPQARMLSSMVRDSSVFGLVGKNVLQKTCVVAFRGTKTAKEWLKDFDFVSEPYRYVKSAGDVHKGFQSVYAAVQTSVVANLRQALPGCTRIFVTGHSLGSALTVLSAPDIARNIGAGIVPELWPFAGPRTGRANFAGFFDGLIPSCYRVNNIWDIVPNLPPPPYQHVQITSEVTIDGGFTLDLREAHDLEDSYIPGLQKLIAP